jgi:hypothetical protein
LRSPYLDDAADVGHGLALGDQLLGGFELMDDLLPYVPGVFYDRIFECRAKTYIRPGSVSGVHVNLTSTQ